MDTFSREKKHMKITADILIFASYGKSLTEYSNSYSLHTKSSKYTYKKIIDPYADSLEARRQADDIFEWLCTQESGLVEEYVYQHASLKRRPDRLACIDFCVQKIHDRPKSINEDSQTQTTYF